MAGAKSAIIRLLSPGKLFLSRKDASAKAALCVAATTTVRPFDGAAAQKISKLVDRILRGVYTREFSIYSAHRLRIRSRSFGEWLSSP
jgi:hypothetical protein